MGLGTLKIEFNFGLIEVLSKGLNWITLPILALIVSPDFYGEIVYYFIFIVLCSTIMLFGQGRFLLQSKNSDIDDNLIKTIIVSFVIFNLMVLGFYFYGSGGLKYYLVLMCAFLLTVYTNYSLKFRILNKPKQFLLCRTYYLVRFLVFLGFFSFYNKIILYYFYIELFLLFLYNLFLFKFKYVSLTGFFLLFKSGFFLTIYGCAMYIIMNFDKLYIGYFFEKKLLAEYALAFSAATSIGFISSYFSIKYEREIYISSNYNEAIQVSQKFLKSTIISSLIVSPFICLAYYFYAIHVGIELNIGAFFGILIGQLLYFVFLSNSFLQTYLRNNYFLMILSVIILVLNIFGNVLLIDLLEINGAVVVNLISFFLMAVLVCLYSRYREKNDFFNSLY